MLKIKTDIQNAHITAIDVGCEIYKRHAGEDEKKYRNRVSQAMHKHIKAEHVDSITLRQIYDAIKKLAR